MSSPTKTSGTSADRNGEVKQNHGSDTKAARPGRPSMAERVAATDAELPSPLDSVALKERMDADARSDLARDESVEPAEAVLPRMNVRRSEHSDRSLRGDTERTGLPTGHGAPSCAVGMSEKATQVAVGPASKPPAKLTLRIDPAKNRYLKRVALAHRMHVTDVLLTALDEWLAEQGHPPFAELDQMPEDQIDMLHVARTRIRRQRS